MATLDPIAVDASNWGGWIREAWRLSWQRLVPTALMLVFALATAYLGRLMHARCVLLFPYPVLAGWGVLLAHGGDDSTHLRSNHQAAMRGLRLLAVIGLGLTLALWALVHAINVRAPAIPSTPTQSVSSLVALLNAANDSVVTYGEWIVCGDLVFFVPLCVLGGYPFLAAHRLAIKGLHLNRHVGLAFFGAGVVMLLFGWILGPLIVVLLPFSSALAYIVFRHIFGGEPPAKRVRASVGVLASAGGRV